MSKFIAIDGLDGSGKGTQSELLFQKLKNMGKDVRLLSFPVYQSKSSEFVRMYLDGVLGSNPDDTNAYAASVFFACDRYISCKTDWKADYEKKDGVIIANRYTTANAVHQLSKLPENEWDSFLTWLWDFEFVKMGNPMPDEVIYLELKPEMSIKLIEKRCRQTGQKKDIHEMDPSHLQKSYKAALYASDKLGWRRIQCYDSGGSIRTRESVHLEILEILGI